MKAALVVFGIFLLTAALFAGAWSTQFSAPGDREVHAGNMARAYAGFAAAGLGDAGEGRRFGDEAAQLQSERQRQHRFGLTSAAAATTFALVAFILSACFPSKSHPKKVHVWSIREIVDLLD